MNEFAFSSILIFITNFPIAILVLNKRGNVRSNKIWAVFCIFISCWGIGGYKVATVGTAEEARLWWQVATIGAIFIPITYYQYIYSFLDLKANYQKKILVSSYVLGFFFLTANFFFPEYFIGELKLIFDHIFVTGFSYSNPLYLIFYVTFYWILLLYSFSLLVLSYGKSSGLKRNQLKYFIIASLIGWLGGHGYFLTAIKTDIYPHANFLIAVYPIIFTYAILRYRLMDIDLVIKKGMVYSLSAGILTSLFVVIIITMTKFFSDMAGVKSYTILVITSLLIAVLFNPLRNRIQRLVDKRFYKRSYDYYSTIQQVSSTLASMFNRNSILKFIGNLIYEVLGLEGVYMLAAVPAEGVYEAVYQMNKDGGRIAPVTEDGKRLNIDEKSVAIKLFARSRDIIVKDELPLLEEKYGRDFAEEVWKDIEKFKGEVLIPVFVDDKLSFLIVLGGKLSGDMFTDEDINMLSTVADQMAIALKNAQLYSGRVQTERLASLGMMSATFAHEIRNPLTSLKTFAQLMPEKYNDPEFRNSFSKIVEGEIEKIDTLIGDLLDFSSEKKSTRVNDFDLVGLVDETVDYIKGKFSHEKESIVVEKMYGEKEIRMSGDAPRLKQAFGIIITNGFQAMNGSGTLSIDIKKNIESIDVAISDTGEGISHEDISKIFDPFVTTKEMGVGIGLAITKRIIEDHEGKIHVKSRLSEGTTFTISLPVNI